MVQIRLLNTIDAEMYRKLRLEGLAKFPHAFGSSYEEEITEPMERFFNRLNEEHSHTYGAFQDGNLIGVVTLVREKKIKLQHRAGIYGMYVSAQAHRKGIGKALMAAAIFQAKQFVGIEQIYLTVSSNNIPAKKLYLSLGFEVYGTDRNSLKVNGEYIDEDLMVLFL